MTFGPEHEQLLRVEVKLSETLWKAGRYNEALRKLQELEVQVKQLHGEHHRHLGKILYDQGEILRHMGKSRESLEFFSKAMNIFQENYGVDDMKTLNTKIQINKMLKGTRRVTREIQPQFRYEKDVMMMAKGGPRSSTTYSTEDSCSSSELSDIETNTPEDVRPFLKRKLSSSSPSSKACFLKPAKFTHTLKNIERLKEPKLRTQVMDDGSRPASTTNLCVPT
ncbi:kinesin light chain 3-like [Limulus polyphemus]|uniref:Kinesin light chain 3-like n=1 Tax=Limulus polyphemus TaxID=6850 RepID=A0ABM1T0Y2_LIMPO|nr:kinesin light chain 3-like [Limulus polyphemus]